MFLGQQAQHHALELHRPARLGKETIRLEGVECVPPILLFEINAGDDDNERILSLGVCLDLFAEIETRDPG